MSGETDVCIRESIRRTKSMDLEFTYTLMGVSLKDSGRTVNKMDRVIQLTRLVKIGERVNGLKVSMLNGSNDSLYDLTCSILFNR